jgi:plasmid stability protein
MAREDPHFRLRLPEELRERIRVCAEQNHRSMTAEIVERLETTFDVDLGGFRRNQTELAEMMKRYESMEATMKGLIALLEEANARAARRDMDDGPRSG